MNIIHFALPYGNLVLNKRSEIDFNIFIDDFIHSTTICVKPPWNYDSLSSRHSSSFSRLNSFQLSLSGVC